MKVKMKILNLQKVGILILSLMFSIMVFSQTTTKVIPSGTINKVKVEEFKVALNRQFTKITTGTAFSNLGNYASISSDAKSFTIGGNKVQKEAIFGFELSGGATEGIFKLFNNEELNSNFGGELKYHKLLKTDFAARDAFAVSDIDKQITDLYTQFSKDSLIIVEKKDLYKTQSDLINGRLKIAKLNKQMLEIVLFLQDSGLPVYKKDSLNISKGLLAYEIESVKLDTIYLNKQLTNIKTDIDVYFLEELEKKEQTRDAKLIELLDKKRNLGLEGFDITWLSFGLRAKNNSFKLFEENNIASRQFIDTSFVSQRFTASISRYRSTSFQNQDVYWSAGLFLDYTTSFNSLSKVLIEERRPITSSNQQEEVKTINAYRGDYKEGIVEFTLFYDYYRFLGKFNSILGLHLNPTFTFSEINKKPITDLFVGVIVPFGDKEKQTSKINVEIFYNKQDVFNYLNKDKSNSAFGIRATLPVNLINNKL